MQLKMLANVHSLHQMNVEQPNQTTADIKFKVFFATFFYRVHHFIRQFTFLGTIIRNLFVFLFGMRLTVKCNGKRKRKNRICECISKWLKRFNGLWTTFYRLYVFFFKRRFLSRPYNIILDYAHATRLCRKFHLLFFTLWLFFGVDRFCMFTKSQHHLAATVRCEWWW